MNFKCFAAGAITAALMVGTALSQTPVPGTRSDGVVAMSQIYNNHWRLSLVVGLSVYNDDNDKLGSIEELLSDQTGKIQAAVLGVGGFLGMGEHRIAVEFDKLKFVNEPVWTVIATNASGTTSGSTPTGRPVRDAKERWYPDHGVLSVTKDQLKRMPEFKYN